MTGSVLLLALLAAPGPEAAEQARSTVPTVEVGPNVRVGTPGVVHVEPYIAAHPDDPRTLIISGSAVRHRAGIFAKAYHTRDGGRTWSAAPLPTAPPQRPGAHTAELDCWVAYAPDGRAYYSALANLSAPRPAGASLIVYRSADGGARWLGPAIIPARSFDAPHIVAGVGDDVYITVLLEGSDTFVMRDPINTVGVAVFRSNDGGISFARTAFITHDQLSHNALNPLVLPDGTLLVPFNEYLRYPRWQRLRSSRFFVVASQDGGRTFGLPEFVAEIARPFPYRPRFAADSSQGRFRGRIYAGWDGEGDEGRNVSVSHSSDGGKSWSVPVALRAEGPGGVYYTCVAVSRGGTVGVAWLQHESAESSCYRVWFAASLDGGESFSSPEPVSDAISCPDVPANRDVTFPPDHQSVLGRWARGGDYFGVAAAADGSFHAAWPDAREGGFQIYTTRCIVRK